MDLQQALIEELALPLPGPGYQLKMAPAHRDADSERKSEQNAAVALILSFSKTKDWEIILTKRAEYNGHHSGQVSFPGGKEEYLDKSLLNTSIRETFEEIGLHLAPENCMGALTPLFIPVSRFIVYPFIFLKSGSNDYTLDSSEVDYMIRVPLVDLLNKSLIKSAEIQVGDRKILTPFYDFKGEMVWGATAMILSEFKEIVHRINSKNPGLF